MWRYKIFPFSDWQRVAPKCSLRFKALLGRTLEAFTVLCPLTSSNIPICGRTWTYMHSYWASAVLYNSQVWPQSWERQRVVHPNARSTHLWTFSPVTVSSRRRKGNIYFSRVIMICFCLGVTVVSLPQCTNSCWAIWREKDEMMGKAGIGGGSKRVSCAERSLSISQQQYSVLHHTTPPF